MDRKQLFAMLDGTPSHVLIVVGLALALLAPLILNFKSATLASAQAEEDRVKTLKALDLEEFKRQQEEERKNSPEVIRYKQALEQREQRKTVALDPALSFEQREELSRQEEAREKELRDLKKTMDDKDKPRQQALEKKQDELDKQYDTIGPRRVVVEAQTAAVGTRSHLVIGWLGRLLLLLGLLILTVQSEGARQKVLLVVLLVVMFSALSGVNLGFQAQGQLGESRIENSGAPKPTPR